MVTNFRQRILRQFILLNVALGIPLLIALIAMGKLLPRATINTASVATAAQIAETLTTNLALSRISLNPNFSIKGHKLQTQPVFFPIASKARDALVRRADSELVSKIYQRYIATDIQLVLSEATAEDSPPAVLGTIVAALDSAHVGESFDYRRYQDSNIHAQLSGVSVSEHNGEQDYWSAFAPVFNQRGETVAMVVVHSDARLAQRLDFYGGLIALLLVAAVIGLSIYFANKIAKHLHNPIKNLHDGMLAFSEGDFSVRLPSPHTGDEMDDLIRHFNTTSQQLRERLDMLQAMEMAAEIQTKLLPTEVPDIHRYDIAVSLQYAELAGGDYYDFIQLTQDNQVSGKWLMVLGDVTGHGVSAALLVAWLRATVRALARECFDDLATLATKLNASMLQDMNTGKFVTLFLAVIDSHSNQLTWLSAGHDPARLFTDRDPTQVQDQASQLQELEACGPPIGVITSASWFAPEPITLADNDRLLIVTDGLQDAKSPTGKRLGLVEVDKNVQNNSNARAEQIKQELVNTLEQHRQGTVLVDDVTFMLIKRES